LKPGGRFAFESRNPAIDWHARWNHEATLETATGSVFLERHVVSRSGNRIVFDTHYRIGNQVLTSRSELAFPTRERIETLLLQSGLRAASVMGDWQSGQFFDAKSLEMIFVASLALKATADHR
jgi:hypothetical protein